MVDKSVMKAIYHDVLGLVDGLLVVAVVVLGVIDLDVVVSNIQQNLITRNKGIVSIANQK